MIGDASGFSVIGVELSVRGEVVRDNVLFATGGSPWLGTLTAIDKRLLPA